MSDDTPTGIERLHDVCKERHLGYSAGWRRNGDYYVDVDDPTSPSGFHVQGKPAAAMILAAITSAQKMGTP